VKPEAADYLGKARHCLAGAKTIVAAAVPDVAAREAYLAVFHAAEAYIFECTGKAAKTHRGVGSQFNRLAQHEPRVSRDLLTFVDEGYQFKAIADYGIGSAIDAISADDATSAIDTAERFIDTSPNCCRLRYRVQCSQVWSPGERSEDVPTLVLFPRRRISVDLGEDGVEAAQAAKAGSQRDLRHR
jgi:uncharacterized protein (UPF0332 family)